ncbi:MAG TPA: tetratricopeptide repeat protein, partial [Chthoniobacterales bacterium]
SRHVADDLESYAEWKPLLHDLGICEVKHGVRLGLTNLYNDEIGNPQFPKKLQAIKRRTRLRWIEAATALVALGAIVAALLVWRQRAAAIVEKGIAVLPFENRSEEKSSAYFADAVQDEILTRLSRIADLKVISRTSTERYKSAPTDLATIAKQLAVANIVEGSVQKVGDVVRINVKLIKAVTGSETWADKFDRQLNDILSVESEVAKAIADHLSAKLTGQEEQALAARPTDNPDAYDAYLRGLAYELKPSLPDNDAAAQKYLREAVRLDPKFALAWAHLAFIEARAYLQQTLPPDMALREEARAAAETALTLQPNLGEALHAKGYYYYALKDYDNAILYLQKARQFLPNSSRIPTSLAYVARRRGQWEQSETYFNEAERLDPRNVELLAQHGTIYICLRRFPEAERKFDQVLNITPDDADLIVEKAGIAQAQGDLARAGKLLAPLHPPADDSYGVDGLVYQAALERRPTPAISLLKELLAKPDPELAPISAERRFLLGWMQQLAGDKNAATETWQQARTELQALVDQHPDTGPIGLLALTNMGLGNKDAALALAQRDMEANPSEHDAMTGPGEVDTFARIAAQVGETDRAIATLQKLLAIPYGGNISSCPLTPALLRLDPMFDPLRNNPEFKKLCEQR